MSEGSQRVLLAEDDELNQQVALDMLEMLGCDVVVVGDGQEALDACQEQSFSLIFMDCNMPKLSGWEAAGAIRKLPVDKNGDTTIIAMTGMDQSEKQACLDAGMNDILTKPYHLADLKSVLGRYLA